MAVSLQGLSNCKFVRLEAEKGMQGEGEGGHKQENCKRVVAVKKLIIVHWWPQKINNCALLLSGKALSIYCLENLENLENWEISKCKLFRHPGF